MNIPTARDDFERVLSEHLWTLIPQVYRDRDGLGSSVYPAHGFIYGTPDRNAPATVRKARPSAELTARQPDYVGSLIDAYASR